MINSLLHGTRTIRNGGVMDYSTYGTCECPTALCHSNDAVNAINQTWNEYYAKQHSKPKILNGYDNVSYILYDGLKCYHIKHTGNEYSKLTTIRCAILDS